MPIPKWAKRADEKADSLVAKLIGLLTKAAKSNWTWVIAAAVVTVAAIVVLA